jgi:hypothetical protein
MKLFIFYYIYILNKLISTLYKNKFDLQRIINLIIIFINIKNIFESLIFWFES